MHKRNRVRKKSPYLIDKPSQIPKRDPKDSHGLKLISKMEKAIEKLKREYE